MFTGIVEEVGVVRQAGERLGVLAAKVFGDTEPGSSLAVNGVCLTAAALEREGAGGGGGMWFELSPETLARSALGRLRRDDSVSLERPVTLLTRLGGHLVQGHVDGVGRIASMADAGSGRLMTIEVPDELRRYVVEKGSMALDGVSLTVTGARDSRFDVA